MTVVMLDAGHGGYDPGTLGYGLVEKGLALSITKKVQDVLNKNGITVHMTRTTDKFITLSERARMANVYHADLFVSFHHNAGGGGGLELHLSGIASYPNRIHPGQDACSHRGFLYFPWDKR